MKQIINLSKEFLGKFDKQKLFLLGSIIGVMVVIIITISIVVKIVGLHISYEDLEEKLARATEQYMNDYPNNLPTESNPTVVVTTSTLVENKYIKEITKYVKDNSCTANINVYYNNGKYKYQPFVICNDFKTELFIDRLKTDNVISAFGEGLYELNGEQVYRGQNPNNFMMFADELWRIVKINANGQFIIIKNDLESKNYGNWDNRYNTEAQTQKGNNTFALSRALIAITEIYREKYLDYEKYLNTFEVCAGKRDSGSFDKSGAIECSTKLSNQFISLLPLYDYMNASLDNSCVNASSRECQNYNYLVNKKDKWWTVTGDAKNSYNVYYINTSGQINSEEAAISANYRYILALDKNVLYKEGTGTEEDPYIIR